MKLEEIHCVNTKVLDVNSSPKPFRHVFMFVKNNQSMKRYDFKETYESIRDLMASQSVNSGILMMSDLTLVFTETSVSFDKVLLKLSTGLNFEGDVTGKISNLNLMNASLGRVTNDKNKNSNSQELS